MNEVPKDIVEVEGRFYEDPHTVSEVFIKVAVRPLAGDGGGS